MITHFPGQHLEPSTKRGEEVQRALEVALDALIAYVNRK